MLFREPLGADGQQAGAGSGGILSARRVKPESVTDCRVGGESKLKSVARFAQGMPESVLVTGHNRLYHGGQCAFTKTS